MDGNLDGLRERVMMDRTVTKVVIGRPESGELGMDALIYMENTAKIPATQSKTYDW